MRLFLESNKEEKPKRGRNAKVYSYDIRKAITEGEGLIQDLVLGWTDIKFVLVIR